MADFDYATASPLMADVLAKQDALLKAGEQTSWAIETSACATTISTAAVNAATADMVTAVTALAEYLETLAPQ
jgi:hypothetical protein